MRYLVVIAGKITTNNFWPRGTSDADTLKLDITDGGIFYGSPHSRNLIRTHVFDNAYCKVDKVKQPVISDKGIVEIRLQGVDAPELHYPVIYENSDAPVIHYRQYLGKTATVDMVTALGGQNKTINCEIWSYINKPSDLFDAYGRAIGYAFTVDQSGNNFDININELLVETGLAFPTFYTSMQYEELDYFHYLARLAIKHKRGVWGYYKNAVRTSKLKLQFKYSDREYDRDKDLGTLIFPKVFRRATRWVRGIEIGEIKSTKSFRKFLKSEPPVTFSYLDDILSFGTRFNIPVYNLYDLISSDNRVKVSPLQVVFYETPGLVYDSEGNEIKDFEDSFYSSISTISNKRLNQ